MPRPGQLVRIISDFDDTKIPVQVYIGNESFEIDTQLKYIFIKHNTIGMFLKTTTSFFASINGTEDEKFCVPLYRVLFILEEKLYLGWVFKENLIVI